jgi:hypothetical protein
VAQCAPPTATVVETVVIIPLAAGGGLYALLQCGEDSVYGHKAYDGYFEMFRALLAEDGESSPPTSRNFQFAAACRRESSEGRQINRIHSKTGTLPRWS